MEFDSVSCVAMWSLCRRELVLLTERQVRIYNSAQTWLVMLPPCAFMDPGTLFQHLQSQAIKIVFATSKLKNEALQMLDIMCRHKRALATTPAVNQASFLLVLTLSSIQLLTGLVNLSNHRHSYSFPAPVWSTASVSSALALG